MVFKPPTAAVLSMEAAVETPLIQTSMHAVKPCSFYFCFFFAFYFRESFPLLFFFMIKWYIHIPTPVHNNSFCPFEMMLTCLSNPHHRAHTLPSPLCKSTLTLFFYGNIFWEKKGGALKCYLYLHRTAHCSTRLLTKPMRLTRLAHYPLSFLLTATRHTF